MKKYYLAHSRADQEAVRKIELVLEEYLHIELINPFWDIQDKFNWNNGEFKDRVRDLSHKELTDEECVELVERDLGVICASDVDGIVSIILDGNNLVGASMEIREAKNIGKRVFIYTRHLAGHAWLRAHATFITDNFLEFMNKLREESKE